MFQFFNYNFLASSWKVVNSQLFKWIFYFFSECGGILQAPSGTLYSPYYPKNYDNNLYCEWFLNFNKIRLEFLDLDLESSPNCTNDYIAFYRMSNGEEELKNKICGSAPSVYNIDMLGTHTLKVVMKTNKAIVKKGFKLQYESVSIFFMYIHSRV